MLAFRCEMLAIHCEVLANPLRNARIPLRNAVHFGMLGMHSVVMHASFRNSEMPRPRFRNFEMPRSRYRNSEMPRSRFRNSEMPKAPVPQFRNTQGPSSEISKLPLLRFRNSGIPNPESRSRRQDGFGMLRCQFRNFRNRVLCSCFGRNSAELRLFRSQAVSPEFETASSDFEIGFARCKSRKRLIHRRCAAFRVLRPHFGIAFRNSGIAIPKSTG